MLYLGLEKIGRVSSLLLEYVFQSKTVTPTESEQVISADSDYNGLSEVTVKAISSIYVGSGIARQGAKTIVPSTDDQVAIPANTFVTGDIVVQGIALQSKRLTPTESEQTIVADNNYCGLDQVVVEAISANYVGSSITRQGDKTITPTKSSQIAVAANTFTTGTITVNPIPSQYITTTDANATETDIVNGQTAYVNGKKVTGTLKIQHYYTGADKPTNDIGVDGDLFLKTGGE